MCLQWMYKWKLFSLDRADCSPLGHSISLYLSSFHTEEWSLFIKIVCSSAQGAVAPTFYSTLMKYSLALDMRRYVLMRNAGKFVSVGKLFCQPRKGLRAPTSWYKKALFNYLNFLYALEKKSWNCFFFSPLWELLVSFILRSHNWWFAIICSTQCREGLEMKRTNEARQLLWGQI